ncbi:hypothetical protein [Ornithinibacillus xuwenensis]|uniref:Uncharacterized protein n=1 Tax=Ornithinibacillus xuwenensis TaxID=3144668 RepID=A0ABU9XKQ6_9BACI
MPKNYGREDVETLLVQLKKYRRIIRSYQENDISLDYYRLKSEFKEIKTNLAETKKELMEAEEKQKDCLFDNQKLIEERNLLKEEISKLEKKIHLNEQEKLEHQEEQKEASFSDDEQFNELVELVRQIHTNQQISGELGVESTPLDRIGEEQYKYLQKCKEIARELVQSLHVIENKLLSNPNREEIMENMVSDKENDENQIESDSAEQKEDSSVKQKETKHKEEYVKGAEPSHNVEQESLTYNNKDKEIHSKDRVEDHQVNSTLTNLQSQITEIKNMLQEKNQKDSSPPKKRDPYNFLQQAATQVPQKSPEKITGKGFTFRDLQDAKNVSQVIGNKPKNSLNHINPMAFSKQGKKPVYVRSKGESNIVKGHISENKTNKITVKEEEPHSAKQILSENTSMEPVTKENNVVQQDISDKVQQNEEPKIPQQNTSEKEISETVIALQQKSSENEVQSTEEPVTNENLAEDEKMEKKSKLKKFWEKLTKL